VVGASTPGLAASPALLAPRRAVAQLTSARQERGPCAAAIGPRYSLYYDSLGRRSSYLRPWRVMAWQVLPSVAWSGLASTHAIRRCGQIRACTILSCQGSQLGPCFFFKTRSHSCSIGDSDTKEGVPRSLDHTPSHDHCDRLSEHSKPSVYTRNIHAFGSCGVQSSIHVASLYSRSHDHATQ
jgi:hypothetical protein